jgi:hypothetical protein
MDVYTDHRDELELYIEKDVDYATVCAHSTIAHSDPLVANEGCLNLHSIDFQPPIDDEKECAAFEELLSEELELRMMDACGDTEEMCVRLCERLGQEKDCWISSNSLITPPRTRNR